MVGSNQPKGQARVVIVDDHQAMIEMLTPVIAAIPGCTVVGHATDAAEAVAACQRSHPDLLLLDLMLRRSSGLDLLQEVRRVSPFIRVLVYSSNFLPQALPAVLASGVHAVVEKTAGLVELRTAIAAVRVGRVYFSPLVSGQLRELIRRPSQQPSAVLSEREKTILRHLAAGFSARETAAAFGLSVYTVANHRRNIMRKIGLRGHAQISLYAAQIGLLDDPYVRLPAESPS